MPERSLCVLPQPKQVTWGVGAFTLTPDTWLALLPGAGQAELDSARALQAEIEAVTGLRLPVVKTAQPARRENIILLMADLNQAAAWLGEPLDWADDLAPHGDQAYGLDISPRRVLAGGEGAMALHHAAQTLRQIARIERGTWPALTLRDWPVLAHRGLMLDVSRGKVPTLETLKLVVDQLSLYKLNVLQLYTEHTFSFAHHPRIGQGTDPLTGDDLLELDAYARRRHVTLMPNLQSFGHMAHILSLPEYAHLAEYEAVGWSLSPQDEGTYALLDDMYGDLLPNLACKVLNINCDETWDLGRGRSAEAVAQLGVGRVYLNHILRLHALASKHGVTLQMWGDILLHHPELVAEVPENVTLMDWHYEAADDYPSVRLFSESGRAFWVCPGTSSWNTLFPRIENSNGNIRTLARLGAEHGAQGLLNTDWGDHGHYQPLGQCWYGYLYACEQAWSGGQTADADFERCLGPLFFGQQGEAVVRAMRRVAALNVLPGMARSNAANSIYALLDEPLVGSMIETLPATTLEEIVAVCEDVEATLRAAQPGSREELTIQEMVFSVRLMSYAARKVLASLGIRHGLEELEAGRGSKSVLSGAITTLSELDGELLQLIGEFETLWIRRARRSEIAITLGHYARLRERFALAQAWLSERLAQVEAGAAPDYALEAYRAGAADYEILGQSFWRRMHESGVTLH
jgi:hypothetical protein